MGKLAHISRVLINPRTENLYGSEQMDLEQEMEPGAGASPWEDRCCNPLRAELLDQDRRIGANINPLRLEIHMDLGLRREG